MASEQPHALTRLRTYAKTNKYPLYVLVLLMLLYLQNQCATFCLVATNGSMAQDLEYGERDCRPANTSALLEVIADLKVNETTEDFCHQHENLCEKNTTLCSWFYTGLGLEYQLLAGPFFIVIFSISGIPMGLLCELNQLNRKALLVTCGILWSIMTSLGGFATHYWHQAVARILLGVFSAGCVPFAASIIASYFSKGTRGAAMGFFNWGVYLGYSMTYVLLMAERGLGWRVVYFLVGVPGIVVSVVIVASVREPSREVEDGANQKAISFLSGTLAKLAAATKCFLQPTLLLLSLAGGIRNGAGFVWAFNLLPFFDTYHPGTKLEVWMSWIPLVFGSIGAFGGGYLSDKLAAKYGMKGRMIVLVACLILSAPFAVSSLFLPMPWAMIGQIPTYVIGEMWIGVCVAVVIDLVPSDLTASAVAVYFFIIQIIGGNMNILEPPIRKQLNMRYALLILYPGCYVVGAILFLVTFCLISRRGENKNTSDDPTTSRSPMIDENKTGQSLRI